MSHALVHLAREAIRHHLTRGAILDVSGRPGDGPAVGVFVSLHDPPRPGESEGRLRGCRGSIEPFERSLFAETVRQAVYSAVDDPRCESVRLDEVDSLEISVYLLDPPESIDGMDQLDPRRFGVIVESGGRRALLLPDLPGIDSTEQQVAIARRKAMIGPEEPVRLFRFMAQRMT